MGMWKKGVNGKGVSKSDALVMNVNESDTCFVVLM